MTTFPNRHDPRLILKPSRDVDLYVGWSTICESPAGSWTRAEALACGIDPARLDRADANGTSFIDSTEGAWDDRVMIAEQRGLLPRHHLAAYAELWLSGEQDKAYGLLEPFEDDDEDEGGQHA